MRFTGILPCQSGIQMWAPRFPLGKNRGVCHILVCAGMSTLEVCTGNNTSIRRTQTKSLWKWFKAHSVPVVQRLLAYIALHVPRHTVITAQLDSHFISVFVIQTEPYSLITHLREFFKFCFSHAVIQFQIKILDEAALIWRCERTYVCHTNQKETSFVYHFSFCCDLYLLYPSSHCRFNVR